MTPSLIFVFAVLGLFGFVSLSIIGIWHSYRNTDMLGGLFLMWAVLVIFASIIYFNEKHSRAEASSAPPKNPGPSFSETLSSFAESLK